jgi:CysZ protein
MNDEFDSMGISSALKAFFGGVGFVLTTPSVWPWAAVPGAIMLILLCGVTGFGWWGAAELLANLFGSQRDTWGAIGYWTSLIVAGAIVMLIAMLAALTLAQPLAGFALERVAHAQEYKLTGYRRPAMSYFASLWLNLRTVAFAVVLGGSALALLFLMNLFYPPAAVVTVPLKFLVCSWIFAWDFIDYPLGLRGLGVRARLRWVFRHFGAFTVFGALWATVCFVPGIALVLLPMGVAGATRLLLQDDPGRTRNDRE